MTFPARNSGPGRSFIATALSLVFGMLPAFAVFASSRWHTASRPLPSSRVQVGLPDPALSSAIATASDQGVLLEWTSKYDKENVGFNVYRVQDGRPVRVTREIIPGSVFTAGESSPFRGAYSYSWRDSKGTVESTYYIESVALDRKSKISEAVRPIGKGTVTKGAFTKNSVSLDDRVSVDESAFVREYAASQEPSIQQPSPTGLVQDQWEIAAQPGLKIFIKKDNWYRVTQAQMAAAGFNPAVDVNNLLLYVDGQELAIRTSKKNGPLSSGDYFEFYGRGLDTPNTDTRTYYLVAGTRPGKRIVGEFQPTSSSSESSPLPHGFSANSLLTRSAVWFGLLFRVLNGTEHLAQSQLERPKATEPRRIENPTTAAPETISPVQTAPAPTIGPDLVVPEKVKAESPAQSDRPTVQRKIRKKGTGKKKSKRKVSTKYHHAAAAAVAPSFNYTVERKDRQLYFSSLLNGDVENFFGPVISGNPVTQTLPSLNPEFNASVLATLEIAVQGVSPTTHEISIVFNDTAVGTLTIHGQNRGIKTISLPLAQLRNGDNTIRLVPLASGVSLVDYARLTYPHSYHADNGSLRFTVRSTQLAKIDGFPTRNLRLIDHTDPFSVRVSRPIVDNSGGSYSLTVPVSGERSKSRRLLYAIPEDQVAQPAGFALNQPSTLNQTTNAADLIVVSHRSFLQSVTPLVNLRRSQGLTVSVVDVEDIYDEFSFGAHGPKAIRDFLSFASTNWNKAPRYAIFVGDASLDPRNYVGAGHFDFVPSKLVDATFSEATSDDWFTDFNDDGIADISVGRLPVRTMAEADLAISKIVNFNSAAVPQKALLVADAQGSYYFNFEQANDEVQSLLPSTMTVQRINRRTQSSDCASRANIISALNQGTALANYSGHGNVNSWSGSCPDPLPNDPRHTVPSFSSADARGLTNGNKLGFVVVMDCLNGYFNDPNLEGIAEALIKAPDGGAVAAFASSGLTVPDGQHAMSRQMYLLLYGSQSIPLGDIVKIAKASTTDMDVRRTWIFFGDPSLSIR